MFCNFVKLFVSLVRLDRKFISLRYEYSYNE